MALIKCTECGKMISSRALKCPNCGCPVVMENPKIICPECGEEISEGDSKCANCGFPISMIRKTKDVQASRVTDDFSVPEKKGEAQKQQNTVSVVVEKPKIVCPVCGKEFSEGESKCSICGCPISAVNVRQTVKDKSISNVAAATNMSTIQYTNTDGDFSALEREAKSGNSESMVRLGSAYENGKGVSVNYCLAYYWYKKAAEMDNIDGMVNYARLLEGWEESRDKAMIWAQKAKALGSNDVYTIIGDEQNRRLNNRKAVFWYNLASQNNEIGAEWKKQSCSSFQVAFQNFQIKNNINWLKIMGVISLLVVFMFFFLFQDVFVGVKLTTPKNDGRICSELIHNAKTLKELEQASRKVYKYVDAYKEKLNNGEMSGPEVKEFFMEVGFVDAAIDAQAAYITEMGNNE